MRREPSPGPALVNVPQQRGLLGHQRTEKRPLTRDETLRWLDDHLGQFVEASVYIKLPDDGSTRILNVWGELVRKRLNYRGRYPGGEPPADREDMVRQLEEREAVYALEGCALLEFTEIEHLDVWIEEGWLDASTHNPVDLLAARLAPRVRLELKYVAGNG